MEELFFTVIVPNYNNIEWLDKSLSSIKTQSYKSYELIVVDDNSNDGSPDKIQAILAGMSNATFIQLNTKKWNGGARNVGINLAKGKYIIFLDSDDWLARVDNLRLLHDFIIKHNEPDFIRLPFNILTPEGKTINVPLYEGSLKEMANSCFVGAPTKCIKREKYINFPENTLMEDAVHHIAQVDVVETFDNFNVPFFTYNKTNTNSCSSPINRELQNSKWKSSLYRMYADLLDLNCKHDYCEERRQWKLRQIRQNIIEENFIQ